MATDIPIPSSTNLEALGTKKKKANKYYLNREIYDSYLRKDFQNCSLLIKNYQSINEAKKTQFHLYMLGLIQRQTTQFDKSLNYFKQCHMMNKLNFQYLKEIAKSLFVMGKHKGALDATKDACKLSLDQQILCLMGRIETSSGNSVEAINYFERSLELQPNDQAYMQLAEIYVKMGRNQKAYSVMQDGLKFSLQNSDLLYMMGLLSTSIPNNNEAEEHFERSLEVNPRGVKSLLALGCMLQGKGEIDRAMNKYRIMHNLSPNSAQLWNNVGLCLMSKQKYLGAYCCLRNAVFLDPFEWRSSANLGIVCLKMKKYALASVNFTTAVSLNPKDTELLMLLGISLAYLNDFANAELAFQEGINIERVTTRYQNSPSLYTNYFLMLLKKGDKASAEKLLEEADKRLQKEIGVQKIESLRSKLRQSS